MMLFGANLICICWSLVTSLTDSSLTHRIFFSHTPRVDSLRQRAPSPLISSAKRWKVRWLASDRTAGATSSDAKLATAVTPELEKSDCAQRGA
jgi:hypothetical protein